MYKYAQLNEDNAVIGISFLSGEITEHNVILLGIIDENGITKWKSEISERVNLGWRYINNEWLPSLPQEL